LKRLLEAPALTTCFKPYLSIYLSISIKKTLSLGDTYPVENFFYMQKRSKKMWTKNDMWYLRMKAGKAPAHEIAEVLGKSTHAVNDCARRNYI